MPVEKTNLPPHEKHGAITSLSSDSLTNQRNHDVEERTPLCDDGLSAAQDNNQNRLLAVFDKQILNQANYLTSRQSAILKIVRGMSVPFSMSTGIPWYQPARDATSNKPLSIIFGVSTLITFAFGSMWASNEIITELKWHSPEEKRLFQNSPKKSIKTHILANLLGLFAAIPGTYTAYKFNNIHPFAFIVLGSSYLFKTNGFYKLLLWLIDQKQRYQLTRDCEQNALMQINQMLNNLDDTYNYLVTHPNIFLNHSKTSSERASGKLLLKLLNYRTDYNPAMTSEEHIKKLLVYASCIFPLISLTVNCLLTLEAGEFLFDSPIAGVIISALTDLPSFALDVFTTTSLIQSIYEQINNFLHGNGIKSFSQQYFNHSNTLFNILALGFVAASAANRWTVYTDTLPDAIKYPFTLIAMLAGAFFEYFIMSDLIANSYLRGAEQYADQSTQKKAQDLQAINQVKCLIKSLSPHECLELTHDIEAQQHELEEKRPSVLSSISLFKNEHSDKADAERSSFTNYYGYQALP